MLIVEHNHACKPITIVNKSYLTRVSFPFLHVNCITSGAVSTQVDVKITAIDVHVILAPGPPCGQFRVSYK